MKKKTHIPVMVQEVLDYLDPKDGETYFDLTLGLGGHSQEILKKSSPTGTVIGIDQDQEALKLAKDNLSEYGNRFAFYHGNFSQIYSLYEKYNFSLPNGILFDLGASSYQFSEPNRGFSFSFHGPLDMRMDKTNSLTASSILRDSTEEKLIWIFKTYGEERQAKRIAREIVKIRENRYLKSTTDLVDLINRIVRSSKIHPATRVFQALRIAVNQELSSIEKGIEDAFNLLQPGGRMVIISFHSLEDRIVKTFFRNFFQEGRGKILTKKPISPTFREIQNNFRSRSAKLRAFLKF